MKIAFFIYPQPLLDLIKRFEGLRLSAYHCPVILCSFFFGHAGSDVFENLVITEQQADDLLKWDVSKCLSQVFTVSPILINAGGKPHIGYWRFCF
ncbi:glycoside hydrolase family protein [Candidatus Liberibacter solanacearum]|uniref:glycoside hydrolase family protein n=1 Tax=Candidatus Liberibacter solanacearum TaxID=556287 RepID=UPI000A4D55C3|nr:hypothetical protein [Candidatus Liberibacter solanacearum]